MTAADRSSRIRPPGPPGWGFPRRNISLPGAAGAEIESRRTRTLGVDGFTEGLVLHSWAGGELEVRGIPLPSGPLSPSVDRVEGVRLIEAPHKVEVTVRPTAALD